MVVKAGATSPTSWFFGGKRSPETTPRDAPKAPVWFFSPKSQGDDPVARTVSSTSTGNGNGNALPMTASRSSSPGSDGGGDGSGDAVPDWFFAGKKRVGAGVVTYGKGGGGGGALTVRTGGGVRDAVTPTKRRPPSLVTTKRATVSTARKVVLSAWSGHRGAVRCVNKRLACPCECAVARLRVGAEGFRGGDEL